MVDAVPDAGSTVNDATTRVAVIGGTSLITSSLFANLAATKMETEHGSVLVHVSPTVVYINRHHANVKDTYDMPHEINYRAIFAALVSLNVRRIYGICSVGSLNRSLPPDSVVLPSDYNSIFDSTAVHMHDDKRAHCVPSLCEGTRSKMRAALSEKTDISITTDTAVYVQVRGPRFETRAEVQFLANIKAGDIIGMTSANEATCASELNIPYAPFCMVDNYANGLAESNLSVDSFHAAVKKHQPIVEQAVSAFLECEGCKKDNDDVEYSNNI